MSDFTEFFKVNSEQAMRFFFNSLKDENLPGNVATIEVVYVASVLANYTQTSRYDSAVSTPATLSEVFDMFVLHGFSGQQSLGLIDAEDLEIAGSQTLLLAGFFRDQMRKRHNVEWYDQLGQSFYSRASNSSKGKKKEVLHLIASHFPIWIITCNNMSRTFRDRPYLLNPGKVVN